VSKVTSFKLEQINNNDVYLTAVFGFLFTHVALVKSTESVALMNMYFIFCRASISVSRLTLSLGLFLTCHNDSCSLYCVDI